MCGNVRMCKCADEDKLRLTKTRTIVIVIYRRGVLHTPSPIYNSPNDNLAFPRVYAYAPTLTMQAFYGLTYPRGAQISV